jgi:hypothetical protein
MKPKIVGGAHTAGLFPVTRRPASYIIHAAAACCTEPSCNRVPFGSRSRSCSWDSWCTAWRGPSRSAGREPDGQVWMRLRALGSQTQACLVTAQPAGCSSGICAGAAGIRSIGGCGLQEQCTPAPGPGIVGRIGQLRQTAPCPHSLHSRLQRQCTRRVGGASGVEQAVLQLSRKRAAFWRLSRQRHSTSTWTLRSCKD